jgi:hypothetical protein
MRDEGESTAQLTATAFTEQGSFYVSSPLTPYNVDILYEQFASLGRADRGDVQVEVELGGASVNSPELRAFTRRMKRLKRHGVSVRLHAARGRKRASLLRPR